MGGPEDTHANKLILGGPEDALQGVQGTHNPDLFIFCEGVRRTLTSRLTMCFRVGGPEDTRVNRICRGPEDTRNSDFCCEVRGGPGDTHVSSYTMK